MCRADRPQGRRASMTGYDVPATQVPAWSILRNASLAAITPAAQNNGMSAAMITQALPHPVTEEVSLAAPSWPTMAAGARLDPQPPPFPPTFAESPCPDDLSHNDCPNGWGDWNHLHAWLGGHAPSPEHGLFDRLQSLMRGRPNGGQLKRTKSFGNQQGSGYIADFSRRRRALFAGGARVGLP